jgi:branched-chain amino acid transport system substrate-binding protein
MTVKSAGQGLPGTKVDKQRRNLLKLVAAGGASAIASPWMFQSSRAAPRTVKIGMVSPETGPIAAFGEADQFVLRRCAQSAGGRHRHSR